MSQYLQTLIDEEVAKVSQLLTQDRDHYTIKHSFQDFARKVRDGEFKIPPAQIEQIFGLMDLLQAHGEIQQSDRRWMLGTFALQAAVGEGEDPAILSRVVIDSVNLSLYGIEDKLQTAVVGGRELFEFFGSHAAILTDEAFRAVMDNSVMLTRYAGQEARQHNLLFDCTQPFFQGRFPANHAFTSLISEQTDSYEDQIAWRDDYGQGGSQAGRLDGLLDQITRAHSLGVKVVPHIADTLLYLGLSAKLQSIRDSGDSAYAVKIDSTVRALLEMVTPEGPQSITSNMLRFPGRAVTLESSSKKSSWLFKEFCQGYHDDLTTSLTNLSEAELDPSVRKAVEKLASFILISSAQAQKALLKESAYDNGPFIRQTLEIFPGFLQGENPLLGLKKEERLAILEAITDLDTKRQLLKKYKSDKGQVLMHDLGM